MTTSRLSDTPVMDSVDPQVYGEYLHRVGLPLVQNAAQQTVFRMIDYPPERRNQKYERTYRFRDAWQIESVQDGIEISNKTPYAGYVVGDNAGMGQAWMHISTDQGKRWPLFYDAIYEQLNKLPDDIYFNVDVVPVTSRLL